jgi:hypothetical protein
MVGDAGEKTGATKKTTPAKRGRGRPRTKTPQTYSKVLVRKIDQMAEAQCKDTTIAESLGMDESTFKADLSARTHKKRQQGKVKLLLAQFKGALSKGKQAYKERIWLGKQHLDQHDRQEVEHTGTVEHCIVLFGSNPGDGDGK